MTPPLQKEKRSSSTPRKETRVDVPVLQRSSSYRHLPKTESVTLTLSLSVSNKPNPLMDLINGICLDEKTSPRNSDVIHSPRSVNNVQSPRNSDSKKCSKNHSRTSSLPSRQVNNTVTNRPPTPRPSVTNKNDLKKREKPRWI